MGPLTYLHAWHMESHGLQGALPEAQRPGKLHLPHLAHRFGQEDEALMAQRCESSLLQVWQRRQGRQGQAALPQ